MLMWEAWLLHRGCWGPSREPWEAVGSRWVLYRVAGGRRGPWEAVGSEPSGAKGSRREPSGAKGSRREPKGDEGRRGGAVGSQREPSGAVRGVRWLARSHTSHPPTSQTKSQAKILELGVAGGAPNAKQRPQCFKPGGVIC